MNQSKIDKKRVERHVFLADDSHICRKLGGFTVYISDYYTLKHFKVFSNGIIFSWLKFYYSNCD